MRVVRAAFVVTLFLNVGCNADRPEETTTHATAAQKTSKGIAPDVQEAVGRIRIGMADAEVDAILAPVALDRGSIYWGGSGAKRMVFQIAPTKQISFEIGGSYDVKNFGKVIGIGPIVPKTRWTRHRGDSITVD